MIPGSGSVGAPFDSAYGSSDVVSEPTTFVLLGVGGVCLLADRWRRTRHAV